MSKSGKSVISLAMTIILMIASCCIFTVPAQAATSVGKSYTLAVGESRYIMAGADNGKYKWRSTDTSTLTVENGAVTAIKKGSAKITASLGGKTVIYNVTVKKYRIEKASSSLKTGARMQLYLKGCGASEKVVWTSSDSDILAVNDFGTVTALKAGTAKIKAAVGKSSVTTTIKVLNEKAAASAGEKSFKTSFRAADVAYIKYTPAVFSDRSEKYSENSRYITDSDTIGKIVEAINKRKNVPCSDETVSKLYREDTELLAARKNGDSSMTSFTVRDSMTLYDKKGRAIAVLSSDEPVGIKSFFLSRVYIDGRYYTATSGNSILLTAYANGWKTDDELVSAAKNYLKKNGKKTDGSVFIDYQFVDAQRANAYKGLDSTNIIALVNIGGKEAEVYPASGKVRGDGASPADDALPDSVIGANALEALAVTFGGPYKDFVNIDPATLVKAYYDVYGEALEQYKTTDSKLITALYNALKEVRVTELYEGPQATDRGEVIGFVGADGNVYIVTFDIGCLEMRDTLYKCDGRKALDKALKAIAEADTPPTE